MFSLINLGSRQINAGFSSLYMHFVMNKKRLKLFVDINFNTYGKITKFVAKEHTTGIETLLLVLTDTAFDLKLIQWSPSKVIL